MKTNKVCFLLFLTCNSVLASDNLKNIGMPVGGICTGQVYLGGDGQLWNWDIFNISTTNPGGAGDRYYLNPMQQESKFVNGFGIIVRDGMKEYKRLLNSKGFDNVKFIGEYPIGKVSYNDSQLPVEVSLNAFSPFIPTDEVASGLPLIIMEYKVTNTSDRSVSIELDGWLQNMSCFHSACNSIGKHYNEVVKKDLYTAVSFSSDKNLERTNADWGSMTIALLDNQVKASAVCNEDLGSAYFQPMENILKSEKELGKVLVGGIGKEIKLEKGDDYIFTFVISWDFPNVHLWNGGHNWNDKQQLRHYYSKNFENSTGVLDYLVSNPDLMENTKLWNKTWYDSTLPKYFLDRTFANVSTLATTASVRFDDISDNSCNEGRYYNFEGVYLGEGTCRHVSHYGQVLGRLFPKLARHHREQIDLGLSLSKDGIIGYRGEFSSFGQHDGRGYAADGQAGTILGFYREHLMSTDNSFLMQNWNKIKLSMQYMINHDKEKTGKADGILEGVQYNTLDRMWYGKIPWISGLYLAALRASAEMADEMGDKRFAKLCRSIAEKGKENISNDLFNGEYFYQKLDASHPEAPNSNNGCHIDQLLGQYWASQLGLGYVFPKEEVRKALKSIMNYNYVVDYSEFLKKTDIPVARWYADENESGVIMCSFPKGGSDKAPGIIKNDWEKLVVGYFSEMWTGQEHALAATMLSEGMVDDALNVEKAINDRYSAEKRNPYNEIEYGNHYTRAMSGYAPFISACGFYYNGPQGIIGFNPQLNPDNFKSAFITAEGWGSYSQNLSIEKNLYTIDVKYGSLKLNKIYMPIKSGKIRNAEVTINGKPVKSSLVKDGECYYLKVYSLTLQQNDVLEINSFNN